MARARRDENDSTAIEPGATDDTLIDPGSEPATDTTEAIASGTASETSEPEVLGRCDVCPGEVVIRTSPKGEAPVQSYCRGCGRTNSGWIPLAPDAA